ncbi:MAG TPA: MFS transporter [Thermomicrobiales bacterium]|nr:MFS transporter [Thermomicrobiales bacterium]
MDRSEPASLPHNTQLSRRLMTALCLPASLAVLNALALSPFLSEIARDLNTSVAVLGQALTVTGLLGATFGLIIGPAAERIGYRRLMLCGLLALIVCDLGTAVAPSFPAILLAQLVGGFSAATITPMAYSIIGTRTEGEGRRRAIATIYAASSAGNIIGFPVLSTIGDAYSWRWSFVAVAVAAAFGLVLAAFELPRDQPSEHSPLRYSTILATYRPLVRHERMRLIYAAQFLRGVAWTGFLTYLGAFATDELDASVQLAGFFWLMISPGFMVGSLLVGGRLRRVNPRGAFALTTTTMGALIGLTLITQPPIPVTFLLLFAIALFGGIAEVAAAGIVSSETPAPQGATMSLHSSVLRFGTATGALVGGGLLALGGFSLLGVGLPIVAAIGGTIGWLSGRPSTIPTPRPEPVRE